MTLLKIMVLLNNYSLQLVSTDVFQLHELRCAKHTVLCNVCQQPISREELQQHLEEEHGMGKRKCINW